MPKICLDDGHNSFGADTGAQGNGLREQDLTLDIVRRIKPLLEYNGFVVMQTRDGDFVNGPHDTVMQSLQTRCNLANQFGADLFVSVHVNSGGGTGSEVYALPGGRGVVAAQRVLDRLTSACGWANRGVKTDKEFYVLVNTDMPAILTENGFIDNASDAAKLADPDFRQAIAIAHAKGICDYFGMTYEDASAPAKQVAAEEIYQIPSGQNITTLNGGYGWLESLPDQKRVIIHADKQTYLSINGDGSIWAYAKDKEAKQLV